MKIIDYRLYFIHYIPCFVLRSLYYIILWNRHTRTTPTRRNWSRRGLRWGKYWQFSYLQPSSSSSAWFSFSVQCISWIPCCGTDILYNIYYILYITCYILYIILSRLCNILWIILHNIYHIVCNEYYILYTMYHILHVIYHIFNTLY